MSTSILKSDLRKSHHKAWKKWIEAAARLRKRYIKNEYEDPFEYNETASVSILTSAAYACGGYALSEYVSSKRGRTDLRKRTDGRDDLFVVLDDEYWVFEAKQLFIPTESALKTKFNAAISDAKCTNSLEMHRGVALLIICLCDEVLGTDDKQKYINNIDEFIKTTKDVKFAVRLSSKIDEPSREMDCFMLFSDPVVKGESISVR